MENLVSYVTEEPVKEENVEATEEVVEETNATEVEAETETTKEEN